MDTRNHKSSSWNPPIQQKNSQFALRPNTIQAQQDSHLPPTQEEIENEAFDQNKFEAFGLQLKEERGAIQPHEQEKLGVLQAKMDDFRAQRLERGSRFNHNFVNIPVHSPEKQVSAPIQPYRGALRQQSPQQSSEPARNGGMGWIQRAFPATSAAPSHLVPLFQAKLNIGQPGDKYEQEADRVASQVVNEISAPASAKATLVQSVQRQEEAEEEVQAKPSISHLQRSPLSPEMQREAMPEEEDLQAKSILQPQEAIAGGEASSDLTSAINSARGGGQPLEAGLQQSMGQAMGADFSGVRVHTDAQSDQLNQSIQAKAFTTGPDVFFRQGAYQPRSRGGQELIAHELTHVVQQNGGAVQRNSLSDVETTGELTSSIAPITRTVANNVAQKKTSDTSSFQFVDNRSEAIAQRELQEMANNSPQAKQAAQLQVIAANHPAQQEQPSQKKASPEPGRRENNTGLPDNLKSGIENLSGYSMDDVKVHYNSDQPSQLQAHAYAQGTDIHVAPGQEKHLPHEAWHVVQQKQGRVKPTIQAKGVAINDDRALEREANLMGVKAIQLKNDRSLNEEASVYQKKAVPFGVVQRARAKDVYKGGGELEYRSGEARLTFGNLGSVTTEVYNEDTVKSMVRQGMKGIPIEAIGADEGVQTPLNGINWALTVETNSGTQLDEEGKINVVLELILGGPTGSTLEQLKIASEEAATAVASLDTNNPVSFSNSAGNVIRDNIKSKYRKKGQALAQIENQDFAETIYADDHPLSKDWSGITINGTWDRAGSMPSTGNWGLQITLGVPLSELGKAQEALTAIGLPDVSRAKPSLGDEVVWSAQNILEEMHKTTSLTNGPLNRQEAMELWNARSIEDRGGGEGTFNYENSKHVAWLDETMEAQNREKTTNLHEALDQQVKLTHSENSAPSLATLNGLCRVLAAYVRGMNGGPAQGPKHTMQFVNKNPLQDVIDNAARTMQGGNNIWYTRLRNACVYMVMEGRTQNTYNWQEHNLTVAAWGNAMNQGNIDLVSVYDKAYRSAQIGHLGALNDVSSVPGKGGRAPIIEFRDLNNTQPSRMSEIFQNIIDTLDPNPVHV
jgi:Domain of unknown function (DUF4157)